MTSSPLFMRVEESTVIFGPIFQVGWASASSTATLARSSGVRPRNGPPAGREHEPGHLVGTVAGPQALVQRTVLGVDGDDLGPRGLLWPGPPPGPRRSGTPCWRGPDGARPRARPASRAVPANPTTALSTTSPSRATAARPSGPVSTSVPFGHRRRQCRRQRRVPDGDDLGSQGPGLGAEHVDRTPRGQTRRR